MSPGFICLRGCNISTLGYNMRLQCRYNYLEKMRGITTFYQMPSGTGAARSKDMVRLSFSIAVPGVENIVIPSGTRGVILRSIDENLVLVHWEVILHHVQIGFYDYERGMG
jgi:hypothetical protein